LPGFRDKGMDPRLRGDDAVVVRRGRVPVPLFRRRKFIFSLNRQKRPGLMSFPRRRKSVSFPVPCLVNGVSARGERQPKKRCNSSCRRAWSKGLER
jgi:hypothetical protein